MNLALPKNTFMIMNDHGLNTVILINVYIIIKYKINWEIVISKTVLFLI